VELVVLDTSELLPALVGRGQARRLLALLGYGRLMIRPQQLAVESAAARAAGSQLQPPLELQLAAAIDRIARANEALGVHAPSGFGLALSPALLDELSRKLRETTFPRRGKLSAEEVFAYRSTALSCATTVTEPFDPAAVPEYVDRDPSDNAIVHTAMLARASYVVSNDADICGPDDERVYAAADGKHHVRAMRLATFATDVVSTSIFELADVPIELLAEIVRGLPASWQPSSASGD
jgi:predicted nucleic acid-binding protein